MTGFAGAVALTSKACAAKASAAAGASPWYAVREAASAAICCGDNGCVLPTNGDADSTGVGDATADWLTRGADSVGAVDVVTVAVEVEVVETTADAATAGGDATAVAAAHAISEINARPSARSRIG